MNYFFRLLLSIRNVMNAAMIIERKPTVSADSGVLPSNLSRLVTNKLTSRAIATTHSGRIKLKLRMTIPPIDYAMNNSDFLCISF
jgi:hypothetical protein